MTNIRIYLSLLAGTLLLMLMLRFQGRGLTQATSSPMGIVSLELASSPEKARSVLDPWTAHDQVPIARKNIWLDFLFIPFYMLLFYTLCGSISVRMTGLGAKLGVLLAFGALIAGLFDVFENILMLVSLSGSLTDLSTGLTSFFASAKFTLLALCLVYVILFGLRLVFLKITGTK